MVMNSEVESQIWWSKSDGRVQLGLEYPVGASCLQSYLEYRRNVERIVMDSSSEVTVCFMYDPDTGGVSATMIDVYERHPISDLLTIALQSNRVKRFVKKYSGCVAIIGSICIMSPITRWYVHKTNIMFRKYTKNKCGSWLAINVRVCMDSDDLTDDLNRRFDSGSMYRKLVTAGFLSV